MENSQDPVTQLLQKAKDLGVVGGTTIMCNQCNAAFPEEYGYCPNCRVNHTFQNLKIDFEI